MSAGTGKLAAGRGTHLVQFYDSDDELAEQVGGYLSAGLAAGERAVVLAAAPHRHAIEARLAAAGIDVAAASASGDLIALDASQTLRRFLIGGQPDPADFERVIGGLLRRTASGGRGVRVYGEMVALLWDAGQAGAAIELEVLWNELAALLPFSLMCGYQARSVSADELADAVDEVCALHSGVIGARPLVT